MESPKLILACGDYDRTRPLIDGKVPLHGLNLSVLALPSAERHRRFVRNFEFDICELQVAQYLGLKSRGAPFTAIPVFPHRRFNHSCVMMRVDSPIHEPADLRGRRVGVHGHFNPIALWIRGVLQHEFNVPPSEIQWITDSAEEIEGWSPPSWLKIERAPTGRKMQDLLRTGEIDAQILSDSGADSGRANKAIRRLWPNYRVVEADYYRRTGIFPIRHLVAVKDQALRNHPGLAAAVVRLFADAKQQAYRYWADHRRSSLAWFGAEQEEERALLGEDPWPYAIGANRVVLETLLDYAYEQCLTERRLSLNEIFEPTTLSISA